MNSVLLLKLDLIYSVYFNNILVWLYTLEYEMHVGDVKRVLKHLRDTHLFLKLKKCKFLIKWVIYLGYILIPEGIKINPDKVKIILKWLILKSIKEL